MKNDLNHFSNLTEKVGNRLIKSYDDLANALECIEYNNLLGYMQVAVTNLPNHLGKKNYGGFEEWNREDYAGVKLSPMISPNLMFDLGNKVISYPFTMGDFIDALEAGHEYGCRCLNESEAKGDWVNGVTDNFEVELIKPRGDLSKPVQVIVSVKDYKWVYSSHEDEAVAEDYRHAILTRYLDWKESYPCAFDQWGQAESFLDKINITAEVVKAG